MMKSILLFVLLITAQMVCAQQKTSKIDSIHSHEDAEKLINSFFPGNPHFKLKNINTFTSRMSGTDFCRRTSDSLGINQPFYTSDLDNNGFTDLLAIGDLNDFRIFIVMNYGGDSLALNWLTRSSFPECSFPAIISDTVIRYYYMSDPPRRSKEKPSLQQTDLVFKFGDFVELHPDPQTYHIEKIEFETTGCYGTCPIFSITITNDKAALFKAASFNAKTEGAKEIRGTFKTTLQPDSYTAITGLLNYIDFPQLKDNYAVNWTDDETAILKITYNNGQVKQIRDYGMLGTYGLDRLYQLFFDLRFNQGWK